MDDTVSFVKKYVKLYRERQRIPCLEMLFESGCLVPTELFCLFSKRTRNKRMKAIKKRWQQRKKQVHVWDEGDEEMPVKDIAVYDLSKRRKTLKCAKERIIKAINYVISPDEIYMYNPDNLKSGYTWYSGQKLIVYQVQKYMKKELREKIWKDIDLVKIGPYDLTDPLHFVKKVILLENDDDEKRRYLVYDMGDDTVSLKPRFIACWNDVKDTSEPKVFKCVRKNKEVSSCRIGQLKVKDRKKTRSRKVRQSAKPRKTSRFLSYAIEADFL